MTFPRSPLEEKVRFLKSPAAYGSHAAQITAEETHMSWVFLAGERVYKLKKPVRYSFLDFRSIQARENDCREEVRLNRRLAEEIYLGVAPLIRRDDGRLSIDGEGRTVDWLVVMRRLPRDRMLDSAILARAVSHAEIVSVADWLLALYKRAQPAELPPAAYVAHFMEEHAQNKTVLTTPAIALDKGRVGLILDFVEDILERSEAVSRRQDPARRRPLAHCRRARSHARRTGVAYRGGSSRSEMHSGTRRHCARRA
jgi:aminoglycoside phosphotransferase family enzyme